MCSNSVGPAHLVFSHEWVFEWVVSDSLAERMYLTENMESKVTQWTESILVVKKSSLSKILKMNLLFFFSPLCLNWFISLERNLYFGYSINQGISIWRRCTSPKSLSPMAQGLIPGLGERCPGAATSPLIALWNSSPRCYLYWRLQPINLCAEWN